MLVNAILKPQVKYESKESAELTFLKRNWKFEQLVSYFFLFSLEVESLVTVLFHKEISFLDSIKEINTIGIIWIKHILYRVKL